MEAGRNPRQTTMAGAWQDAESEQRLRLNEVFYAADAMGYDGPIKDSLKAFLRLVFERTNGGRGPSWTPEKAEKTILAAPGGPSCKRSRLFQIIADARDAGILAVVPGSQGGSSYAIDWQGVYVQRGRTPPASLEPAPSSVAEAVEPVHAVDTPVHAVDTPVHAVDWDFSKSPPHAHPLACGGPRVDLILEDEEEKTIIIKINSSDPVWQRVVPVADDIVWKLFSRRGVCPSMSRRLRTLLASIALLSEKLGGEWLADAIDATLGKQGLITPTAWLHTCLQNGMPGHFGEAPERLKELLDMVRNRVARHLNECHWNPQEAFANRLKQEQQVNRPAWALTDAEREAERQSALESLRTQGTLLEMSRRFRETEP